jgi:hypothetical protein
MAQTNILGFNNKKNPSIAQTADPNAVQALNKQKPDVMNKSLLTAQEHAQDVMQGDDPTSKQILNQFSEQSAASASARRGAAAQRAELSGASQSTQNILGQLTDREIEQQRQTGITEIAKGLGARADDQAAKMLDIGKFEETQGLEVEKFEEQKDQFDKNYELNKKQVEHHIAQGDQSMALELIDNMEKDVDWTNEEEVQKLNDLREENGLATLTYDDVIDKKFDQIGDNANIDLNAHITTNKSAYFDDATGEYDINLALEDEAVKQHINDIITSQSNGTDSFDPTDPEDIERAKAILDPMFTSTTEAILQTMDDDWAKVESSDWFNNLSANEQQQEREAYENMRILAQLGVEREYVDGKLVYKLNGEVISESTMVADKSGNIYTSTDDGVTVSNDDGTLTDYYKNEDGEWVTDTTEAPTISNTGINKLDKLESGEAVEGWTFDSGTGAASDGSGNEYGKNDAGEWEITNPGTTQKKADSNTSKYLDSAQGDEESLADEFKTDEVTIPKDITEGGMWIDEDSGEFYVKSGGTASIVDLSAMTPNSSDFKKVLAMSKDNPEIGKTLYDSGAFENFPAANEKGNFKGSSGDSGFKMQDNAKNEVAKLNSGIIGYYPKAYNGENYFKDFVILHDPTGKFEDGETVEMSGHDGFNFDLLKFGQVDGRDRPHGQKGQKAGGRD